MTQKADAMVEGGCACGAVRYRLDGKMGFSFHCQCRDCQYLSGTSHASAFICQQMELAVDGDLSWYPRQAPSGNIVRSGFCPICGTSLMNENSGYPEIAFINAGTLDDPNLFIPTKVVHREDGLNWDFVDPEA